MQWQGARAGIGEVGSGDEGAAFEGDPAGELGGVAVAGLGRAKVQSGGGGCNLPGAGFGHHGFSVGAGSDTADADDPAVTVMEHERALSAEFGVAKGFGQALAVKGFGFAVGPLGAS